MVHRPATAGPPGATPKPTSACFIGRGCSWSTSLDFPLRLYSAQCEAWAGILPLEGIPATPAPTTTLASALVYGGWIGSPSHLLSVQRDCSGQSMPLLGIIPDGMLVRDAHKLGPTCWWPDPPSGEGGTRSPEKRSRGRLMLWTHTDTPLGENFSVPDWLFLWPLLFRDHPSMEAVLCLTLRGWAATSLRCVAMLLEFY